MLAQVFFSFSRKIQKEYTKNTKSFNITHKKLDNYAKVIGWWHCHYWNSTKLQSILMWREYIGSALFMNWLYAHQKICSLLHGKVTLATHIQNSNMMFRVQGIGINWWHDLVNTELNTKTVQILLIESVRCYYFIVDNQV